MAPEGAPEGRGDSIISLRAVARYAALSHVFETGARADYLLQTADDSAYISAPCETLTFRSLLQVKYSISLPYCARSRQWLPREMVLKGPAAVRPYPGKPNAGERVQCLFFTTSDNQCMVTPPEHGSSHFSLVKRTVLNLGRNRKSTMALTFSWRRFSKLRHCRASKLRDGLFMMSTSSL